MEAYPVAVSLIIAALMLFVIGLGAMWKLGKMLGAMTTMLGEIKANCPIRKIECDTRFDRLEGVVFLGSSLCDDDQLEN